MDKKAIEKSSPLYNYWHSDQNDSDEANRLLMVNPGDPAKYLFEKEPYKWENLYQAILREIVRGDLDSIRGLRVLINTISQVEREKLITLLENQKILNDISVKKLRTIDIANSEKTKKNMLRFLRILATIFLNPYRIQQKRPRNHLYERTGFYIYRFLSLFG
ncbi:MULTISPECIES: hypothetical protein [Prochlorococcus]|uniref:hypothetical protein n=1 Tax=Prochlorococcus TaxID=1218 RepID=UPI000533AB48|nr:MULTISPECIES: hypothetical protein [Prochlorococcus]KGG11893.1 hypothetical protein EV05_1094 [Prochlorococcus sp. MIT 0601]